MIDHYDWGGGREAMIRFGFADGPVAIVALPPFEEANRTRTFAVTMLRALARRGICGVLPDLPGTNESIVATEDAALADWRAAFAAAAVAVGARHGIAIRGGALVDTTANLASRWHLSPQAGTSLVRELDRLRQGGDGDNATTAGNRIAANLLDELGSAHPAEGARVIRLASDAGAANLKVDAAPLWRRAEPGNDPALAEVLADDIASWVRRCGG